MQDLRLAVRSLLATPLVTLVAVLSLALGIGANTAIFSLVDHLVLKALPVAQPSRLFLLSAQSPTRAQEFSYATFRELRRQNGVFTGVLGFSSCCGRSIVRIGGTSETVDRQFVTGDFFSTLGLSPHRGRLLAIDDDQPSAPFGPVVVIGFHAWQRQFGGRPDVVSSSAIVDGVPVRIVGVAPPTFDGVEVGRTTGLFIPQYLFPRMTTSPFDEDTQILNVFARLRAGVTAEAAMAAMRAAQPAIRTASMPKKFPSATFLPTPFTLTPVERGTSSLRSRFEKPLVVIFGVVGLVLLIACANIGSLLLARAMARQHELSVRVALGASRWQLARQFFVESALLALVGAAAGVLLASWSTAALVRALSTVRDPISLAVALDGRVLAFATFASVLTALLFGIVPAVRATKLDPIDALKAQGRTLTGRTSFPTRLLFGQIVLSMLLVVAAGLFVSTFERLTHVALGLDTARTIVATVTVPTIPAADRPLFFDRMTRSIGQIPGVTASGGALNPPLMGTLAGDLVVSDPGSKPSPDAERIPEFDSITPHWFAAYGIPLLQGRDFDERDTRGAQPVMIVSEAFVRRLFPHRDVIGMPLALTFRFGLGDYLFGTRTIVGVVADSVHRSPRDPMLPMIYVPLAQREPIPQNSIYIGVRSAIGSPSLLQRQVADTISRLVPDVAVSFEPLGQQVDDSVAQDRVVASLAAFFGGLALLLAALGLYGATAYTVARRRAEFAIRLSLGAQRRRVVQSVLSHVWSVALTGIAIGLILSMFATRLIQSLLYGVEPRDPAILGGSVVLLLVVSTVAGWLPAWRASRIDPAEVLREA